LLAITAGCAMRMDLPEPFLRLDTSGDQLKATTPDDARLWVREFQDDDQGSLEFWVATLRNALTQSRGYALTDQGEVRDAGGLAGRWMELRAQVNGEPWGYLVALFVDEGAWSSTIRVVEFVAREEAFAAQVPAIRTALATLRR
jgi:hypothetical protein